MNNTNNTNMKAIRSVTKQGNSVAVTIPKNWGFKVGDFVILRKQGESIKLEKVKIDED